MVTANLVLVALPKVFDGVTEVRLVAYIQVLTVKEFIGGCRTGEDLVLPHGGVPVSAGKTEINSLCNKFEYSVQAATGNLPPPQPQMSSRIISDSLPFQSLGMLIPFIGGIVAANSPQLVSFGPQHPV
jgi:hypothetical protein